MKTWREWIGRVLRIAVPLLISALAIWWVGRKLNLGEVWTILKNMRLGGLFLNLLVFVTGLVFRALSFSVILGANFSHMASFHGMNAGYFLNNILPLRLGEFGRAALLVAHSKQKASFMEVFAGIVTERTLDVVIGLVLFIGGLMLISSTIVPLWIMWLVLVLLIGIVVLAALGAKHKERVMAYLWKRYGERKLASEKLLPWFESFLKGFEVFLQPKRITMAIVLLFISWLFAIFQVYLLQNELMPGAQWWWPFLVVPASTFIMALPSLPGGIGVYEVGFERAYALVGADANPAIAVALVMHIFQLVVPTILGVIGVYALGENIGALVSKANFAKKEVENEAEAERVEEEVPPSDSDAIA